MTPRSLLAVLALCLGLGAHGDVDALAQAAAGLPVLHMGRVKPMDTLARHLLLGLGSRDREPDGTPAISWLVGGWMGIDRALDAPVVRLRNPEVSDALGLPERKDLRYTPNEILDALQAHGPMMENILARPARDRGLVESQLAQLAEAVESALLALDPLYGLDLIPGPEADRARWMPLGSFGPERLRPDPLQARVAAAWLDVASALFRREPGAMAGAAERIRVETLGSRQARKLDLELAYNRMRPFRGALVLQIPAALLAGVALAKRDKGRRWRAAALSLLAASLLPLFAGIGLRSAILGRMPVSNLYESILFVAGVTAFAGFLLEVFRRDSLGALTGAAVSALLLRVSMGYAVDGDNLAVLQAVLNSNMWLGIHVLTISTGYGLCLITAAIAHFTLLRRIRHPGDADLHLRDDRLLLTLSLVSLLFTLSGTILGGMWADQSWGRFWGWDPKENGALLIILWLAFLLHLKLAGQCGGRGFALGACLLSIVVAIAWFGVNLLGIGLHSYGFDSRAALGLALFFALQIALVAALALGAPRQPGRPA